MYQIKVNDQFNFAIDDKGKLVINGKEEYADIRQLSDIVYHVIYNDASYNIQIINLNKAAKTAEIKVNGNIYRVAAKDQFDLLLDQLGMSGQNVSKISEIKAPMPGLVLKIFVAEGEAVKKGDNLFILEAMKMENIIKAPADVTIGAIKIKAGDKVEKGQILMQF